MTKQTRLALQVSQRPVALPKPETFMWYIVRDTEDPKRLLSIGLVPSIRTNEQLQQEINEKLNTDRKQIKRFEQKQAWQGWNKKYYFEEYQRFSVEKQIKIEDHTAELIARKIVRHFKFTLNKVKFYGNGGGHASYWHDSVTLPHNPSVVMIAHELAHLHNKEKYNNGKHNKRLAATVKRFIAYGHKMKYWEEVKQE
jgi:hypothetical protein